MNKLVAMAVLNWIALQSPVYLALLFTRATAGPLASRGIRYEGNCDFSHDAVITPSFFDAVVLSKAVLEKSLADGTGFWESTAYANYFPPNDVNRVRAMFESISKVDQPWENPAISLICDSDEQPSQPCQNSDMLTYPDPPIPSRLFNSNSPPPAVGIGLCPLFFDQSQPTFKHIGTFQTQEWCKRLKWPDIEIAGTVIINGLVQSAAFSGGGGSKKVLVRHRDSEGTKSDLFTRANAHGTSELMLSPNDKEPRAMGADPGAGGSQQIIQNSHKFGAAATEFYFLQLCGKRKDDRV